MKLRGIVDQLRRVAELVPGDPEHRVRYSIDRTGTAFVIVLPEELDENMAAVLATSFYREAARFRAAYTERERQRKARGLGPKR